MTDPMNVSDAIASRRSVRAFLDTPVPEALVREILAAAAQAPSGGNLQPWRVYVVAGEARDELVATVAAKLGEFPMGEGGDYDIYPPELTEPYKARRAKVGEDMYALLEVKRDDKAGKLAHLARNFKFFDAPVGLFFAIDRQMGPPQFVDLGAFMQNIMLLARTHGLDTCPQESWSMWTPTLVEFLSIPKNEMLFCGMSLGYADQSAPVNRLRTPREIVDDFTTIIGN